MINLYMLTLTARSPTEISPWGSKESNASVAVISRVISSPSVLAFGSSVSIAEVIKKSLWLLPSSDGSAARF